MARSLHLGLLSHVLVSLLWVTCCRQWVCLCCWCCLLRLPWLSCWCDQLTKLCYMLPWLCDQQSELRYAAWCAGM